MIFICYSQEDAKFRSELELHFRGLKFHAQGAEENYLDWWSDARIDAGDNWEAEIEQALEKSRVAILLVSPDFLASEFIAKIELPYFEKKLQQDEIRILWVLLKDCYWSWVKVLKERQAIRSIKAKPLVDVSPGARAAVWKELVQKAFEATQNRKPTQSVPREKKTGDAFHVDEARKGENDSAVRIDFRVLKEWCLSSFDCADDHLRPLIEELKNRGTESIKMPWTLPEPHGLPVVPEKEDESEKKKKLDRWCVYERLTARLYPRFRDAHLALLLHAKHNREDFQREREYQELADRDQIKRILWALLRKQMEFRETLKAVTIKGKNEQFTSWRSYLNYLPDCHLALLWGVECVFNSSLHPFERRHWLNQCTVLSERLCHWLLQAHAVARCSLPPSYECSQL